MFIICTFDSAPRQNYMETQHGTSTPKWQHIRHNSHKIYHVMNLWCTGTSQPSSIFRFSRPRFLLNSVHFIDHFMQIHAGGGCWVFEELEHVQCSITRNFTTKNQRSLAQFSTACASSACMLISQ